MATAQAWAFVVGLSLLPPLLYALWLRAKEQVDREPMRTVLGAFVYGGTVGVAVAILLHEVFNVGFVQPGRLGIDAALLTVVVGAPIVEELSKGLGLGFVRPHVREYEDGLIYGAAIGLGFAATENLLYGITALTENGAAFALWTIVLRIFSSMLLHLAASALVGFGYSRALVGGHSVVLVLPYYLLAVVLHAAYNFLVTLDDVGLLALGAALFMVVTVVAMLQRRIETLDALPHRR